MTCKDFIELILLLILPEYLSDEELGKVIRAVSTDLEDGEDFLDLGDAKLNCIYAITKIFKDFVFAKE